MNRREKIRYLHPVYLSVARYAEESVFLGDCRAVMQQDMPTPQSSLPPQFGTDWHLLP